MQSAITHPTPQRVVDAIHVVAAYLREIEAAEAVISPAGGAAFHPYRHADALLVGWQRARSWAASWKAAATWWRRQAYRAEQVVDAAREALGDCDEPTYVLMVALSEYDHLSD